MSFFRPTYDLSQAVIRPGQGDDTEAVARLLHEARRRYINYNTGELGVYMASGAASALLFVKQQLLGVLVAGWSIEGICWLRMVALADGAPLGRSIGLLLSALHDSLAAQQIQQIYYAEGLASEVWIQPLLLAFGYRPATEVIGYEKHELGIPSFGNQQVRVRAAQAVDLSTVLQIDHASFAPAWMKDDVVLGPSLSAAPFFVIAEQDGEAIGYAFATTHFAGDLVHLVRIAVLPAWQGQGVGVRLLAETVQFAQLQRSKSITLNTQVDNHTAQRLYEWFGFRRNGERQAVLRFDLAGTDAHQQA